jgi:hypothetical protein
MFVRAHLYLLEAPHRRCSADADLEARRSDTTKAKQRLDLAITRLQNLQYEAQSIENEIRACRDFRYAIR